MIRDHLPSFYFMDRVRRRVQQETVNLRKELEQEHIHLQEYVIHTSDGCMDDRICWITLSKE